MGTSGKRNSCESGANGRGNDDAGPGLRGAGFVAAWETREGRELAPKNRRPKPEPKGKEDDGQMKLFRGRKNELEIGQTSPYSLSCKIMSLTFIHAFQLPMKSKRNCNPTSRERPNATK
jgi:hypothetical protein